MSRNLTEKQDFCSLPCLDHDDVYLLLYLEHSAKERELQELRMIQEQTQNQMAMYQNMQRNYEQQRRYLHDYKNQLPASRGCWQKAK